MTKEQVIASGRGHLLDDATPLRCSKCGGKSWGGNKREKCTMPPMPDGSKCDGLLN